MLEDGNNVEIYDMLWGLSEPSGVHALVSELSNRWLSILIPFRKEPEQKGPLNHHSCIKLDLKEDFLSHFL